MEFFIKLWTQEGKQLKLTKRAGQTEKDEQDGKRHGGVGQQRQKTQVNQGVKDSDEEERDDSDDEYRSLEIS